MMSWLRRLREWLQGEYLELRFRVKWKLAFDPLGSAMWGCLLLGLVLHIPLLAAGIAAGAAHLQGLATPSWVKTVVALYVILYIAFYSVSSKSEYSPPPQPPIDESVVEMVYQMQDVMDYEETEEALEGTTAAMDYVMTAMDVAVELDEALGKRRGPEPDEEE